MRYLRNTVLATVMLSMAPLANSYAAGCPVGDMAAALYKKWYAYAEANHGYFGRSKGFVSDGVSVSWPPQALNPGNVLGTVTYYDLNSTKRTRNIDSGIPSFTNDYRCYSRTRNGGFLSGIEAALKDALENKIVSTNAF